MKIVIAVLSCWLLAVSTMHGQSAMLDLREGMMIRISEIEIHPEYLQEYNNILREEAGTSVRLEPGVIAIFPMYQKANPAEVRILEIYASQKRTRLTSKRRTSRSTKRRH